jgi:molybdate transport system substrate-binding protein
MQAHSAVLAQSRIRASKAVVRCLASALLIGVMSVQATATGAELKIVAPNAVKESITEIASRFERETGHRVVFAWGGSESIARRVGDGEAFDVVVNTATTVERLEGEGRLVAGTRTDFARSGVGVAVRAGLPRPDVSTPDALRAALLDARAIAISSGASGRYLEQLFQRLDVADQIRTRIKQPPSGAQIAEMIARGEVDLGFQQVTELRHAKGIEYLGPLPPAIQSYTVWSAARHSAGTSPEAASSFLQALRAPASWPILRAAGLERP